MSRLHTTCSSIIADLLSGDVVGKSTRSLVVCEAGPRGNHGDLLNAVELLEQVRRLAGERGAPRRDIVAGCDEAAVGRELQSGLEEVPGHRFGAVNPLLQEQLPAQ